MKGKKSSKKVSQKSSFSSFDPVVTSRSIISLLIVLLAASIFFLFNTYQQNIMQNNMFYPFMTLTVVGMGLLVSLLFLINPAKAKKK